MANPSRRKLSRLPQSSLSEFLHCSQLTPKNENDTIQLERKASEASSSKGLLTLKAQQLLIQIAVILQNKTGGKERACVEFQQLWYVGLKVQQVDGQLFIANESLYLVFYERD